MRPRSVDRLFHRFAQARDPALLAAVFDATAPDIARLARYLAPDATSADDLVQATFVTAIESADQYDPDRELLPWLLGVLANHARHARRRAQRAIDPDRVHHAATTDPGEAAGQRELDALLTAAIDRLGEPYRPVLRLHLQQGMAPAEIARVLERPGATVRAQIARGLDRIRGLLPPAMTEPQTKTAPSRSLEAVRAAVLARLSSTAMHKAVPILTGALLMKTIAITGASAIALLLFLWQLNSNATPPAATDTAVRTTQDQPASTASAGVDRGETERTAIATPAAATPDPATSSAAVTAGRLRVRVRRERDGSVAPGVAVALHRLGAGAGLSDEPQVLATGDDGAALFEQLEPGTYFARMMQSDVGGRGGRVTAGDESVIQLELPRGLTVTGTVQDAAGRPVPGAAVLGMTTRPPHVLAHSGPAGEFRLHDLGPGMPLMAHAAGRVPSLVHQLPMAVGDSVEGEAAVVLTVGDAGREVRGTVRAAVTDEPVADALVAVLDPESTPRTDAAAPWRSPLWVRTDRDGRFVFEGVSLETQLLVAQGAGAGAPGATTLAAGNHAAYADIRLQEPATVLGSVFEDGAPRARVTVLLWASAPDQNFGIALNSFGMRRLTTNADGRFEASDLLPGEHEVKVIGRRGNQLHRELLRLAPGARQELSVHIGSGAPLHVLVQPASPGTGMPWMLMLHGVDAAGQPVIDIQPVPLSGRLELQTSAVPHRPRSVSLQLRLGGAHFVVVTEHVVPPGAAEVALEVAPARLPSARLNARLLTVDGRAAGGARVRLVGPGSSSKSRIGATADAQGHIDVGPLPPGEYQVIAADGNHLLRTVSLVQDRTEHAGDLRLPQ